MQNISTVYVKGKQNYNIIGFCSYFAKCSPVLAISIPYCATVWKPETLILFRQQVIRVTIWVSLFLGFCLCVAAVTVRTIA